VRTVQHAIKRQLANAVASSHFLFLWLSCCFLLPVQHVKQAKGKQANKQMVTWDNASVFTSMRQVPTKSRHCGALQEQKAKQALCLQYIVYVYWVLLLIPFWPMLLQELSRFWQF
jgi:hypothetical protein